MRIITGLLKGRQISVPKAIDVRPTTDRTKEGLFSTLEAHKYIRNAQVLDLFAGSGNLGFEAISRGAENVHFVDSNRRSINHIEKVAREFKVQDQVRLASIAVEDFLKGPAVPYDFIFADPPYDYGNNEEIITTVLENGWLQPTGWLILEHNKYDDFRDHKHCIIEKEYGKTLISIFSPTTETDNQ